MPEEPPAPAAAEEPVAKAAAADEWDEERKATDPKGWLRQQGRTMKSFRADLDAFGKAISTFVSTATRTYDLQKKMDKVEDASAFVANRTQLPRARA